MSEGKKIEYDIDALKSKADLLGIQYPKNITGAKLKQKIDLHLTDIEGDEKPSEGVKSVGPNKAVHIIEKEAREPILCVVTDLDPQDRDNPTIVKGVQNAYFKVGPVIIKKDEEQYVPQCIVEALKAQTMVKMVPSINLVTRKPTGNKVAELTTRYSIRIIPS